MANNVQRDLIEVIVQDHQALADAFAELETRTGSPETRRGLAEHVIAELVRHAVAEEQFLYPTARVRLTNGDEIADKEIAEHTEAERVMRELDRTDARDPLFDQLLGQLIQDVRNHIQDEETNLLPRLRSACSDAELRELGKHAARAKEVAPTRPHSYTPHRPPANLLLGPGIGLVDRIRDRLSGRHT